MTRPQYNRIIGLRLGRATGRGGTDAVMILDHGTKLGPYEILEPLGAGGMGEVYRATDTRLNRPVAIKVSAARFSERFEREANVIASLNHPHICHLYDIGPNYLVMEFIEGTQLRGPLPLKEAAEYAGQILDALDAAHRRGITHRDLKLANILVTKQGVKLLDFGLAKRGGPLQETDATLTAALTGKGEIIGTLQYMSPEQLQGKEADPRSDLFSFGCVFYEMVAGKRAFEGQSAASVIAAILEHDPVPLDLAPPLERVIRTCLAKDPEHRFQTALDLKRNLMWALEQPPTSKSSRRAWIAAAGAALILGAFGGGWAVSHFRQPPTYDHVIRFQIAPPEGGDMSGGGNLGGAFAISPDGRTAAFVAVVKGKMGLWVRPLVAANGRLIRGTEGATRPFWSPDSRSIAFGAGGALQRVDLSQETVSKVCDVPGVYWGGSWSSDGRMLFVIRDVGIFQVPAAGGAPSQVTAVGRAQGDFSNDYPQALPGGRFLYGAMTAATGSRNFYAASLTKPAERVRLLPDVIDVRYASAGEGEDYLLWVSGRTLMAQRFDAGKLRLLGEPHALADPAATANAGGRVLLYSSSIAQRQLKWVDRRGNEIGVLGEPGPWAFSRISPGGRRVVTSRAGDPLGIWLLDIGRGFASRLSPVQCLSVVWSPDGKTIVFTRPSHLSRMGVDGTGNEESITESTNQRPFVSDWSRDGRLVIYTEIAPDTGRDLWVLPVTPEGRPLPGAKPRPFVREPFNQGYGRFSPDTRWVAYQSDESGQYEIYVRSFPDSREKLQISTAGGDNTQWAASGHELFYRSRDGKLVVVSLRPSGSSLNASLPHELFALPVGIPGPNPYDVAPDGQRFLVNDVAPSSQPLNVIVNWQALLKKGGAAP
jgi:Tol biopolymer transport system component/predicted Ser/Thr protein kinase